MTKTNLMMAILCLYTKLNNFLFKRKPPKCYLFSSKFILMSFIMLLSYFLVMDIVLLTRMKRGANFQTIKFKPASPNSASSISNSIILKKLSDKNSAGGSYDSASATAAAATADEAMLNSMGKDYDYSSNTVTVFSSLPVKRIMMAEATHYIRSPIAHYIEYTFGFSQLFPFISANVISLFHCFLSIVCIKFLTHDELFWRQFGVCLFQFRNFLDSFDGVIYRAHARKAMYKSHYGSLGYFVDSTSDVIGGLCLIGSVVIYLLKHPPSSRSPSCFNNSSSSNSSISSNDLLSSAAADQSKPALPLSNGKLDHHHNHHSSSLWSSSNPSPRSNMKLLILTSVGLFGIRFALSALFWDRSVHAYEDLLDCIPKNELQQQIQMNILKSTFTMIIMFSWRLMSALSLQDFLLTSIFIDKIWEFIAKSQYIGWLMLITLVTLTELHLVEIKSILDDVKNSSL